MSSPPRTLPFAYVFWAMGFGLALLHVFLFLQLVAHDDLLMSSLYGDNPDSDASFVFHLYLSYPVFALVVAILWVIKVPRSWFELRLLPTIRHIAVFVLILIAFNVIFVRFFAPLREAQLQAGPVARLEAHARAAMGSPPSLMADGVLLAISFWWAFGPGRVYGNHIDRRVVVGACLAGVGSLLIFWFVAK